MPVVRIRGRQLIRLRWELWVRDPHCAVCRHLLTYEQMVRDHVIPLAEGGLDTPTNVQALCEGCHEIKSEAEAKRGVTRYRKPATR